MIQSNLPGSSLWYSKLAFQREILDQLQKDVDPDYYSSWARMEKRAQEDNAPYWWKPGQQAPERAPELENARGK